MKKNRMLRLASALLILTLLTTSVIGGTFAKYVSTGSVSDTARVAKWGVEIKTSGTLYSDAYAVATAANDKGNLPIAWQTNPTADSITVAAAAAKQNIVAPGTKSYGDGLSFALLGKPEVAVDVTAKVNAEDIYLKEGTYGVLVPATTVEDKLSFEKLLAAHSNVAGSTTTYDVFVSSEAGGATTYTRITGVDDYNTDNKDKYYILTDEVTFAGNYFPVVYTLGGTTDDSIKTAVAVAGKLATTIQAGVTATESKDYKTSFTATAKYPANTDLATGGPEFGNKNLKWEWAYEDTTEAAKIEKDEKDTILGDLIAMREALVDTNIADPDYVIVNIAKNGATEVVTKLVPSTTENDYTVSITADGTTTVVANLNTSFDIELTVTQVD